MPGAAPGLPYLAVILHLMLGLTLARLHLQAPSVSCVRLIWRTFCLMSRSYLNLSMAVHRSIGCSCAQRSMAGPCASKLTCCLVPAEDPEPSAADHITQVALHIAQLLGLQTCHPLTARPASLAQQPATSASSPAGLVSSEALPSGLTLPQTATRPEVWSKQADQGRTAEPAETAAAQADSCLASTSLSADQAAAASKVDSAPALAPGRSEEAEVSGSDNSAPEMHGQAATPPGHVILSSRTASPTMHQAANASDAVHAELAHRLQGMASIAFLDCKSIPICQRAEPLPSGAVQLSGSLDDPHGKQHFQDAPGGTGGEQSREALSQVESSCEPEPVAGPGNSSKNSSRPLSAASQHSTVGSSASPGSPAEAALELYLTAMSEQSSEAMELGPVDTLEGHGGILREHCESSSQQVCDQLLRLYRRATQLELQICGTLHSSKDASDPADHSSHNRLCLRDHCSDFMSSQRAVSLLFLTTLQKRDDTSM